MAYSIPICFQLDDETSIFIDTVIGPGRHAHDVADMGEIIMKFSNVTDAIEKVSKRIIEALRNANPDKASVEFGFQMGVEAGELAAMIVKGTADCNLKVTLEWTRKS